jgi:hypothetical protein
MTILGLLFMILSWIFIIGLMIYSYAKIFAQDSASKTSQTEND